MPCARCFADCCRQSHVVLSAQEAVAIAAAQQLPLAAFVALVPRSEPEGLFRILLPGPTPDTRVYCRMQLRRVPAQTENLRCVFLLEQTPPVRCGIYPQRPRACHLFPHLCDGDRPRLHKLAKVYCPPGAWDAEPIDVPRHRLLRQQQDAERARFDQAIDEWNDLQYQTLADETAWFAFLLQRFSVE